MRYEIMHKSASAHCCFEASVVDTETVDDNKRIVCECFWLEHAELIRDALNGTTTQADDQSGFIKIVVLAWLAVCAVGSYGFVKLVDFIVNNWA